MALTKIGKNFILCAQSVQTQLSIKSSENPNIVQQHLSFSFSLSLSLSLTLYIYVPPCWYIYLRKFAIGNIEVKIQLQSKLFVFDFVWGCFVIVVLFWNVQLLILSYVFHMAFQSNSVEGNIKVLYKCTSYFISYKWSHSLIITYVILLFYVNFLILFDKVCFLKYNAMINT